MQRLQLSSLFFAPCVFLGVAQAANGARLAFTHVFATGTFVASFLNHSRCYYEGPRWDLIDLVDRALAACAILAGTLDVIFSGRRWKVAVGAVLGTCGLLLYAAAFLAREKHIKGAAPARTRGETSSPEPETLHALVHACAGLALFAVLL